MSMAAFIQQNESFADLSDDEIAEVNEFVEHHSGGLLVIGRWLNETTRVKVHDSWGPEPGIVVHIYDTEDPEKGVVMEAPNCHEAVKMFFKGWDPDEFGGES